MNENTEHSTPRASRIPIYRRIIKVLWALTIIGILSVAGLFFYLSGQDLPSFEELENPSNKLASEVYAADNSVLGRYYVENRVPVEYDDLSPHLISALLSTEDERYYEHSGIDMEALTRVFVRTVLLQQRSAGGGSTITQQLAKLLYTNRKAKNILERGFQKLKEWITSVKLERSYTKEEIIAMYLNQFNFINGAYGIKAASEIYFNKAQNELDIQEAATLIGMLKNPALFNPVRFPDTTMHRRMVVLKQMEKNEHINTEEYDSLKTLPLSMEEFNRATHADGLAPYFRMELRKELNRILERKENRNPDGSKINIYKDGLKIYTTLDPVIQKYAEEATWKKMKKLQKRFFKVWKNKDPWTYRDYAEEEKDEKTEEEIMAELETRANKLKKDIRNTKRYGALRQKHLMPVINTIKEASDYELKDFDIRRMILEDEESGLITKLVSDKMIPSSRAVTYRKIMAGENWDELKEGWATLNEVVEESFTQPVKMKIFDYNEAGETDTVMTPLDSIKYHRMILQAGVMAVDPRSGFVKAWVGGVSHKYFQFDHVTSERQVGSTFKPFVYATAIAQQGMSPCHVVHDLPYTIHSGEGNFGLIKDWTPANANNEYSGQPFTLMKGLQWSKNTVSVYLMKQLGDSEPVRALVNNMGLSSSTKRDNGTYRIPKQPSICLGATDLTVFEMTGAYTTFANNGIYNKPIFISKIVDKNGRIIYSEIPEEHIALDPNANYVMLHMLKNVMNQGLPGFSSIKSEVGGKTGTTNDYVDGWFMGLTPDLVVGTWVGGEDRWIRFLSLNDGIGAKMARPIFADLLKNLEKDSNSGYNPKRRFKVPTGDIGIELDCGIYQVISDQTQSLENGGDNSFGDEELDDDYFDEEEIPQDSTKLKPIAEDNDEEEDFGEY